MASRKGKKRGGKIHFIEGWMWKKGGAKMGARYQNRYFVVSPDDLKIDYFEDESLKECRGTIDLGKYGGYRCVKFDCDSKKHRYGLLLVPNGEDKESRTWSLCCETKEDHEDWYAEFNAIIDDIEQDIDDDDVYDEQYAGESETSRRTDLDELKCFMLTDTIMKKKGGK